MNSLQALSHKRITAGGGFNCSSQHPDDGGVDGKTSRVDEGVDRAIADEVTGGSSHRREIQRSFWNEIATGRLPEECAHAMGVSQAVGGGGSVTVAVCHQCR